MQTVEAIQEWEAEQKQLLAAGETNQALESLRVAGSQPSVSEDGNFVTMPKHDKVREKPGNFVFMWNEQNYLLKMCTDLNFLRNWRKF